jgi:hypothetical protein
MPTIKRIEKGAYTDPTKALTGPEFDQNIDELRNVVADVDYLKTHLGGNGEPPVSELYSTIAAMLADQSNQLQDWLYKVTDASADPNIPFGKAIYQYLGTATADLTDYQLIWEEHYPLVDWENVQNKPDLMPLNPSVINMSTIDDISEIKSQNKPWLKYDDANETTTIADLAYCEQGFFGKNALFTEGFLEMKKSLIQGFLSNDYAKLQLVEENGFLYLKLISKLNNVEKTIDLNAVKRDTATVSGTKTLDWQAYGTFYYNLTGNTTFTDVNLPSGDNTENITLVITGSQPTFPSYWKYIGETYVPGSDYYVFAAECVNGNTGSELVVCSVSKLRDNL